MQPGWSEHHRFLRYRTDLPLRVRSYEERDLDGHCFVMAEDGLGGDLPEPIPVGSQVQLWVAVPTHPVTLHVWAVVRCQIGLLHTFEFVSITDAERLSIRQFCKELGGLGHF